MIFVHNKEYDQLSTTPSPCEVADESNVGDLIEPFSGCPANNAPVGAASAGTRVHVVDMLSDVKFPANAHPLPHYLPPTLSQRR